MDTFPFEQNIEAKPICMIVIRIIPQKTNSDFTPDMRINYGMYLLVQKISNSPFFKLHGLEIKQLLYHICITVRTETLELICETDSFIQCIIGLIDKDNDLFYQNDWPFRFCYTIAADYSSQVHFIEISAFDARHRSFIWLDNIQERIFKIVDYAPSDISGYLITHAFYDHLSASVQSSFSVGYYVMHICCYNRPLVQSETGQPFSQS